LQRSSTHSRRRTARVFRVANLSQRRPGHSWSAPTNSKSRCARGRRFRILAQRGSPHIGMMPPSLARVSRPSRRGSTRTPRPRALVEGIVPDGLRPLGACRCVCESGQPDSAGDFGRAAGDAEVPVGAAPVARVDGPTRELLD
jgi:hypothetical protein